MLETLEKRVRDIVEERDRGQWPVTKGALRMASLGYGAAVRVRARLYAKGVLSVHRLPCKVISIGNLTVGGTGKTPMTIYLARLLQRQGKRVTVISRGYQGAAEKSGGVVSDGCRILMKPEQAGDEPCMMAHQLPGIPVLVGQNRYRSGLVALEKYNPDVILLDDGYQHLRLHRDLNILLLDARLPIGNGCLLPLGRLREPPSAGRRADIIIFTRARAMDKSPALPNGIPEGLPVFQTIHKPFLLRLASSKAVEDDFSSRFEPITAEDVAGNSVYAFSGIADNDAFQLVLKQMGLHVLGFRAFTDHHRYSSADLDEIVNERTSLHSHWLATTEKDFYRLPEKLMQLAPLIVVGIEIVFPGTTTDFNALIRHFSAQ